MPRTIFLLQNVARDWMVRTGSSNGQKVSTNESYSSRAHAVRAFITEGRHQPHAHMVLVREGLRPVTIRAGKSLPAPTREAEDILAARISAAFEMTRPTH